MRRPGKTDGGPRRILSLTALAKELGVAGYRVSEWVRLGLLRPPIVMGMRGNGRVTAYGFHRADVPAIRRRVALLNQRADAWRRL